MPPLTGWSVHDPFLHWYVCLRSALLPHSVPVYNLKTLWLPGLALYLFLDYLDVEGGPLSLCCSVAVWLLLPSSFLSALPLVALLLCICLVVIC